jgi:hypothetical protein
LDVAQKNLSGAPFNPRREGWYCFHSTAPFHDKSARTTIAFDVVPMT